MARRTKKAAPSPIPERLRHRRPSAADVRDMTALCGRIEELVNDGATSDEASADLREQLERSLETWHSRAHRKYESREFTTYYGAISTEEFVRSALAPAAGFVSDLTFAEARAVLDAVCKAELAESATFYFLEFLEKNLPDANVSDLIYWPNQWFEDESLLNVELSADQMLGYAMQRAGRKLAGTPDDLELPHRDPKVSPKGRTAPK